MAVILPAVWLRSGTGWASGREGKRGPGPFPRGGPPVDPVEVAVHRLDPEQPLPAYAHPGDAGTDPTEPFTVRRGDRIAQLVVQPVVRARFVPVPELPPPPAGPSTNGTRGTGGFGSTGR